MYLSAGEDQAIRAFAERHGAAFNTTIRIAIRRLVGLDVPEWADRAADEQREEEGAG